jgi:hypothetical protein
MPADSSSGIRVSFGLVDATIARHTAPEVPDSHRS